MPRETSPMAPIALLSVSNKTGLLPFAKALKSRHGFKLISSGGTAKALEEGGLSVSKVADYTGSPEILGGRVKTLHPRIHGGILAKREDTAHKADLEQQEISPIDLVVVNLYPFIEVIKDPQLSWEKAIENIDIGGPAMVRAAAKNHTHVVVLTNPDQYAPFLEALSNGITGITKQMRRQLALEAFEHTASYDVAISKWISNKININKSPLFEAIPLKQSLRYGENPHQSANWYSTPEKGWGGAIQLQGKELSTNNLLDLEASLATIREFGYGDTGLNPVIQPAAVVVKHTNPCGVARGLDLAEALSKALDADRISAFGGIVALNCTVCPESAKAISNLFLECIVAPGFEPEALDILAKKTNLRLLKLNPTSIDQADRYHLRSILGGVLVQEQDDQKVNSTDWFVPTKRTPTNQEKEDLDFAWRLVRHVRSNAIVIASSGQSLGIGAGQMNRVGSAKLAIEASGKKSNGAVMASDGFFPFDDTVRLAGRHGIKAIIQPGGSLRDQDSISACDELGIAMIFTKKRHFLH